MEVWSRQIASNETGQSAQILKWTLLHACIDVVRVSLGSWVPLHHGLVLGRKVPVVCKQLGSPFEIDL